MATGISAIRIRSCVDSSAGHKTLISDSGFLPSFGSCLMVAVTVVVSNRGSAQVTVAPWIIFWKWVSLRGLAQNNSDELGRIGANLAVKSNCNAMLTRWLTLTLM